jgi:hypothetical protein
VGAWGGRLGERHRRRPIGTDRGVIQKSRAVLQSVATLGICLEEAPAVTRPPGTVGLRAGPAGVPEAFADLSDVH